MKKLLALTLATTGLLCACSSNKSTEEVVKEAPYHRTYVNVKPTAKDTTTAWEDAKLKGAAIEGEGYREVLAVRRTGAFDINNEKNKGSGSTAQNTGDNLGDAESLLRNPTEHAAQKVIASYSIYEMARWERFCGGSKMDRKDWDFVSAQGIANVPTELKMKCSPPSYGYSEYLRAWDSQCNGAALTDKQKNIIKATHPASKCTKN